MTLIAYVSLLIAIVGAAVYFVAANPKLSECGRLAYFAGLVAFCFAVAGQSIRLG